MTLNDHLKQIQALIAGQPEVGEMELMQMSCFDDPLQFATSSICIGECYTVVDQNDHNDEMASFKDERSAKQRCEEEGNDWTEVLPAKRIVVIEAY